LFQILFFLALEKCPQCQRNPISEPNPPIQTSPNKRRHSDLYPDDEETDDITPVYATQESNPGEQSF